MLGNFKIRHGRIIFLPLHFTFSPPLNAAWPMQSKQQPFLGHEAAKVNVKFALQQTTKAQRRSRGIAYSFFNFGARWDGWSTPHPGRITPGKTRYPFYRRLGGPQGRSGRVRKISPPPEFDLWTVQPVASCNTDYEIASLNNWFPIFRESSRKPKPIIYWRCVILRKNGVVSYRCEDLKTRIIS